MTKARDKADGLVTATGTTTPRSLGDRFGDLIKIKDFESLVVNGDWTVALQTAMDHAGLLGRHLSGEGCSVIAISSVNINYNTFIHGYGVTVQRLDMTEVNSSITADGAGMFKVASDGLSVTFKDCILDGNNVNQPITRTNPLAVGATTNPYSALFLYIPINNATATDCRFSFIDCKFIRGSWKYLYIAGDTIERRFRTIVHMHRPIFEDSILGYGANDPLSADPIGHAPDYVIVMDYVEFTAYDFDARFDTDSSAAGDYAPSAIRATYRSSIADSGQASVRLYGTTKLRGLGRKYSVYNDLNTFGNNAIGVIDVYGNGDTLFVENFEAYNSKFVTIRAKGSIDYFDVKKGYLKDCIRGVQVSPSSTGTPVTKVSICDVTQDGGQSPAVECVGNSALLPLPLVRIKNITTSGTNNAESNAVNAHGDVYVRYVTKVRIDNVDTTDSPVNGVLVRDCGDTRLSNINTDTCADYGIYILTGTGNVSIKGANLNDLGSHGVNITSNSGDVLAEDVYVDGCNDYGVFVNSTGVDVKIKDSSVSNMTGLQRAYYYASNGSSINNKVDGSVAAEIFTATGVTVSQDGDYWRGRDYYGTTIPTTGTYNVGDRLWRTNPVAAGPMGWVCTVSGTPGTWVAMADLV